MTQAQTMMQGPASLFSNGPQRLADGLGSSSTEPTLQSANRSAFAQPSSVSAPIPNQFNPLLSPFSPGGYQMPLGLPTHPLLSRPSPSGLVPPALSNNLLPTDIAALLSHIQQQQQAPPQQLPQQQQQQQAPQQNPLQQPSSSNGHPSLASRVMPTLPQMAPASSSDPSAPQPPSSAPGPGIGLPDTRISLSAQDLVFLLDLFARGVYPNQQSVPPITNPLAAASSLWPGAALQPSLSSSLPSSLPSNMPSIGQLDTTQPLFPLPSPAPPAAEASANEPFPRANGHSNPKKRHAESEPLAPAEAKTRAAAAAADGDEKGPDGKSLPRIRCSFPNCTKSFTKMTNLRRHQRLHNGHKPFTCPWTSGAGNDAPCGKRFARRADLRAHERTHTGEKPYQCSVCSRTFARNSDWRSHERTHQKIKPFTCDVAQCHRSFARRTDIKKHFKTHAELSDAEIAAKIQNLTAHRSSSAESDHHHDSDSSPPSPIPALPEKVSSASKKRKGTDGSAVAEAKIKTTMTSEQAESWWDMLPSAAPAGATTSAASS